MVPIPQALPSPGFSGDSRGRGKTVVKPVDDGGRKGDTILCRPSIVGRQGLNTLTRDSPMVSSKQAPGRGIRARNQARPGIGGEQGARQLALLLNGFTARGLSWERSPMRDTIKVFVVKHGPRSIPVAEVDRPGDPRAPVQVGENQEAERSKPAGRRGGKGTVRGQVRHRPEHPLV